MLAPVASEAEVIQVAEVLTAAVDRLQADGLPADGVITEAGREFRDRIEAATDAAQAPLLERIGDRLDAVTQQPDTWSQLCVLAGAFPPDIRKRAAG